MPLVLSCFEYGFGYLNEYFFIVKISRHIYPDKTEADAHHVVA